MITVTIWDDYTLPDYLHSTEWSIDRSNSLFLHTIHVLGYNRIQKASAIELQATGKELAHILTCIKNLPDVNSPLSKPRYWHGDLARFIIANLPLGEE